MPCRYRACHAFGRRHALAAVPPLRVADAAVRLRKIILLYKLFIQYFELYRDAEFGSAGVQTFASGGRNSGVQEYRHLHREYGMRDAGVQTFASGVRNAECRSTDICIGMRNSGVQEYRHLHREGGIRECRSTDICIGSTECGMQECRHLHREYGMRNAGVQTFASGCGMQECRHLHRDAGVRNAEFGSTGVQTLAFGLWP